MFELSELSAISNSLFATGETLDKEYLFLQNSLKLVFSKRSVKNASTLSEVAPLIYNFEPSL